MVSPKKLDNMEECAFQAPPGSQASSRGEAKDSALLSSRHAGLLELSPVVAKLTRGGGKPSCPSPSAGDLRELPGVPLRGEGSCGGGGVHVVQLFRGNHY